ncbi:hypothetical protein WN943_027213 [Citrus x changshan-huyou]
MIVLNEENDEKESNRDEEETEGEMENRGDRDRLGVEVHMPVVYERLPDFCYCCGIIGHQFRECIKYKNQPQDKLEYGPHLKAATIAEKKKQDKERNRRKSENNRSNGNEAEQTARKENQTESTVGKHIINPPNPETIATRHQSGEEVNRVGNSETAEMVVDTHLMLRALNPKCPDNSCTKQSELATEVTSPRKASSKEEQENEGNKKRETEAVFEKGEMIEGTEVWENDKNGSAKVKKLGSDEIKNLAQKQTNQGVFRTEKAEREREVSLKPKIRKWKLQAREVDNENEVQEKTMRAKRPASELNMESPKAKKNKGGSPHKNESIQRRHYSQKETDKGKEHAKGTGTEEGDEAMQATQSAVAEIQHRRQI